MTNSCIPRRWLCSLVPRTSSRDLHRYGNEVAWWANVQIAAIEAAKELWEASLLDSDGSITRKDPPQHDQAVPVADKSSVFLKPSEQQKIGEAPKLNFKNGQTATESWGSLTVPAELVPFSEPSFEVIRQMTVDDIRPETNIEWLWTLDLVELSWEILRYRRFKKVFLGTHRVAAIEAILLRLDGEGMPRRGHANGAAFERKFR